MSGAVPTEENLSSGQREGVVLICRHDGDAKTGLTRYCDIVDGALARKGVESRRYRIRLDGTKGMAALFYDGLVKPFVEFVLKGFSRDLTVHATDEMGGFFFPWSKGFRVVTVHHVISPSERGIPYYVFWKILATLSVRHADSIIAISDETAIDVVDAFGVDPRKITVVPHRPSPIFKPTGAPRERKVCCVAELTPRKNISDSIAVFDRFLKLGGVSDYRLVICGKGSEKESLLKQVLDLGLSDNVVFVSDLSDAEMVNLYETSVASLCTSLHEGFGLTPLEAQSCGTPTLHFSHSRWPAVALGASVPCRSIDEMAQRLHVLATDGKAHGDAVEESLAYVRDFNRDYDETFLRSYSRNRLGNDGKKTGFGRS